MCKSRPRVHVQETIIAESPPSLRHAQTMPHTNLFARSVPEKRGRSDLGSSSPSSRWTMYSRAFALILTLGWPANGRRINIAQVHTHTHTLHIQYCTTIYVCTYATNTTFPLASQGMGGIVPIWLPEDAKRVNVCRHQAQPDGMLSHNVQRCRTGESSGACVCNGSKIEGRSLFVHSAMLFETGGFPVH